MYIQMHLLAPLLLVCLATTRSRRLRGALGYDGEAYKLFVASQKHQFEVSAL